MKLSGYQRFTQMTMADLSLEIQVGHAMRIPVQIVCRDRLGLSWKETLFDKLLSDLDSVGGSALAEVVGNAPEVKS